MNYTDADIRSMLDRLNRLDKIPVPDYVPRTDYSAISTISGWTTYTVKELAYTKLGKLVFVHLFISGQSDAASASFTLPFSTLSTANLLIPIVGVDNAARAINSVLAANPSSATFSAYTNHTGSAWTASGTKTIAQDYFFQAA